MLAYCGKKPLEIRWFDPHTDFDPLNAMGLETEVIEDALESRDGRIRVAELYESRHSSKSSVVGFVLYDSQQRHSRLDVKQLFVGQEYRGIGVGSAMWSFIGHEACKSGDMVHCTLNEYDSAGIRWLKNRTPAPICARLVRGAFWDSDGVRFIFPAANLSLTECG